VNARRTGRADARLVRPPITDAPTFTWDEGARRVLSAPGGFRRVLGGPGTGKTALLASAATRRIAEGADPESVLVLTSSRRRGCSPAPSRTSSSASCWPATSTRKPGTGPSSCGRR
jgi:hypothetical protein